MKKTIKKIVSGIASIVLGFSMITSSQVFAKNDDNPVKLECGSEWAKIVPSENGASKIEGMASDGENIYVVKVDKAETIAKIHRYNLKGERVGSGKLPCKVGHANDMTAVKYNNNNNNNTTHLLVLQHDKSNSKIYHFTVEKNAINTDIYKKVAEYTVKGAYNGIALGENKGDKSYVLYLRADNGKNLKKVQINLKAKRINTDSPINVAEINNNLGSCKTSQGIAYDNGAVYMAFSQENGKNSNKYENKIFKVNVDDPTPIETNVTIDNNSKNYTSYFEIESCVIVGKYIYICTNSNKDNKINYDGIYKINKNVL